MENSTIYTKIKLRLNKIDSGDYDNIECYAVEEAFNKATVEWCRRQLHGMNNFQEGDEGSNRRVDDLNIILTPDFKLNLTKKDLFYESDVIPQNYFQWKRVDIVGSSDCCSKKPFIVYLAEEDNRTILLRDEHKKPSFEWGETFATLVNGRIRIYTNNDFEINEAKLTYYRQPRRIEIAGCSNPYDIDRVNPVDVISEFKDDIVELMVDDAVSILAGDLTDGFNQQRGSMGSERNN